VFNVTRNPFVYGEVVPAAAFINRVAELAEMLGAGGSSKSLAAGARELQAGAAEWKRAAKRG